MYDVLLANLRVPLYIDLPNCNTGCLENGNISKQRGIDLLQRATNSLVLSPQQCCSAVYLGSDTRPRCHWNSRGDEPTQGVAAGTSPDHAPGQSVVKTNSNPAGTFTPLISALHQLRCQPHSVYSHSPTLRSFWESMGLLLLKNTQVASAQLCLKSKLVHAFPSQSFGRNNRIERQLEDLDKKYQQTKQLRFWLCCYSLFSLKFSCGRESGAYHSALPSSFTFSVPSAIPG